MTKTLTEQYKNKELSGWHYVKAKDGSINHWLLFTDSVEFETDKDIEEVLAPVPSYDEYKRLQEQLKEANEIIESFRTYDFTVDDENAEAYQVKWNVKAKRFYKNKKWGVK